MGVTFADVDTFGLLKELYDDDVRFQENIMSSLYNFVKTAGSGDVEFDGKYFNIPLQLTVNESYASINDTERLPEAGSVDGVFAKYRVKLSYSTLEATTFAATRGHKNGRPDGKYLDSYIKSSFLSMLSNLDSDLYGNGRGYRATVQTAVAGASSFEVTFSTRLRPLMKFDWYDSTYTTKRGSIQIAIKGIDRMNRTAFISTTFGTGNVPVGATAGDKLVVYGALDPGEPADGRYAAGFQYLADATKAVGLVSPAEYAVWSPTNLNAANANPSQELLQQYWDTMYQISGVYPNRMWFNPSWKRAYLNQFFTNRRFNSNVYDTGASSVTFSPVKMGTDEKNKKPGEFKMLEDKNADPQMAGVWNYDAFCKASDYSDSPHLADEDGSDFRFRYGYDAMQGFLRQWWQTVVYMRNALGLIYNFAPQSGVI